jgi:hypothetical protein
MRVLERDFKRWISLGISCTGKQRTPWPPLIWTLDTWSKCNDDDRMKMSVERPSFTHLRQLKPWGGDHESKPAVEELSRPGY